MNRSKQIGSLFLVILLSIKMLIVPIIFLDYEVRKAYIIKNLCVNRNRPQLHCDGKCYLAKQIAAAEQKEQTEKGQELNRMLFGAEFMHELHTFEFKSTMFLTNPPKYSFKISPTRDTRLVVFHPPIFS